MEIILKQEEVEKLKALAMREHVTETELVRRWIDEKTREICVYEYGSECLALTDRECEGCRFFKSKVDYIYDIKNMEVRKK